MPPPPQRGCAWQSQAEGALDADEFQGVAADGPLAGLAACAPPGSSPRRSIIDCESHRPQTLAEVSASGCSSRVRVRVVRCSQTGNLVTEKVGNGVFTRRLQVVVVCPPWARLCGWRGGPGCCLNSLVPPPAPQHQIGGAFSG